MAVTTEDGVNFVDDGKCPLCGEDTHIGHTPSVIGQLIAEAVICPNCGDVTDAVFDGMDVHWEDLDHSHDVE